LWISPADAIGSVASYIKAFNWQTGMPTHYPVSFDKERLDMDALMAPDILPTFSVASITAKGARLRASFWRSTLAFNCVIRICSGVGGLRGLMVAVLGGLGA
jgi:hypothetical protein